MSTQDGGFSGAQVSEHPLASALAPDPTQLPTNAVVLEGIIGKSAQDSSWRVYIKPDLSEYWEVPQSLILHTDDLPNNAGTRVWVPGDCVLDHGIIARSSS
jgi:hypothetical protein